MTDMVALLDTSSFSDALAYDNNTTLGYRFWDKKENVFIPIITFSLCVVGNMLAIVTLMLYKCRRSEVPRRMSNVSDYSANHQGGSLIEPRRSSTYGNSPKLSKRRKIQKFGAFHMLVLSLAILDLLGTIAVSPITFLLYLNEKHIKQVGGESLCNYSAFAMMFFGFASMALVMAMSIERFLSIQHAFFYHRRVTAYKTAIAVCVMFVIIATICAMPVMGFGTIRAVAPNSWCFADWNAVKVKDKVFNYIYASLGIIMLTTTVICNIHVIKGLVRMQRKVATGKKRKKRFLTLETQMIIQLLAISIIFAVCWLPLMLRIILNQVGYAKCIPCDRVAIWLAIINPILDPWVYILFRRSLITRLVAIVKMPFCYESSRISTEVVGKWKTQSPTQVDRLTPPIIKIQDASSVC